MAVLTQARLHEVLNYDPETGVFTWRMDASKRRMAGKIAGTKTSEGYIEICVDKTRHRAHRLAWLYVTGAMPAEQIDHINRQRADNRFCNLREATNGENGANRPRQANNLSGYKGVYWSKRRRRWIAKISVKGRDFSLGTFSEASKAADAYAAAVKKLHGKFARTD